MSALSEPAVGKHAEEIRLDPLACRERLEGVSQLLATVEDLHSAPELKPGLESMAGRLASVVPYDTFAVLLLDDLGQELRFHFARGFPDHVVEHWRFGLGQGLVGLAASTGESQVSGDVRRDPRYLKACEEVRSEAALPLKAKNRVVGVLDVGRFETPAFAVEELRFLKFIAGHLANAIDNGRLYANLKQQATTLSALHEASRELTAILDRQELLSRVGEILRRQLDHQAFNVMLWDDDEHVLMPAFSVSCDDCCMEPRAVTLGEGLVGTAAALRQTLRVPNVQLDPRYTSCGNLGTRSEIDVPLVFKDRLLGVLNLESCSYNAFTQEHEQFLSTLASYVAIALENARLYERLREDEHRLARDLEMARSIQEGLLPRATPWIPGLQIGVAYAPARHLGGDFYDFLSYGEHRTAFVVGDVAGKGAGAALFGTVTIGMLRGYAAESCSTPSQVLGYLNEELRVLQVERRFVALTFAIYDRRDRSLILANAGLPFPFLVRGGEVQEIEIPGLPLGSMAGTEYRSVRLELRHGDSVVFATDGIEEFRNRQREAFGEERLRAVLRMHAGGTPRDLAEGLIAATDRFIGDGRKASDDRTAVVLKALDD